jgi:hypothetical protein
MRLLRELPRRKLRTTLAAEYAGTSGGAARSAAREALASVGLADRGHHQTRVAA